MAYSNWGAFVYKNGERQKNREDVGVFDEDEAVYPTPYRIFANLIKNGATEGKASEWYKHSHHGVLGSGAVRLAAYKCQPMLYVLKGDGSVEDIRLPDLCYADGEIRDAVKHYWEHEGGDSEKPLLPGDGEYKYSVRHYDGNMIDLELIEPDGTKWTATAGMSYGAGHMDDDGKPFEE